MPQIDVENPVNGYSGLYSHIGNTKLGREVSVINREAGATCPGESDFCTGCYAKRGVFTQYNIQAKYRIHLDTLRGLKSRR